MKIEYIEKTYTVKLDNAKGETVSHECILLGKRGDKYGHVQCIKTGIIWGSYGYGFFPECGEVKITKTFIKF